jgi:tetratricopeptide (TPR) repeat protein
MVPCTFEANANILMDTSEWQKSFEEAERWFWDQPFSSRPVIFASYLASNVLGLPDKAVEMIDKSLISNPCDEMLLNNRAFALAQLGRLDEARAAIADGKKCAHDAKASAPLTATEGMIEMRAGNLERGQELYRSAISIASKAKNQIHKEVAEMHLAIELAVAGRPSPELEKLLSEGAKSSQKLVRASALGLQKWVENLPGKSRDATSAGIVARKSALASEDQPRLPRSSA